MALVGCSAMIRWVEKDGIEPNLEYFCRQMSMSGEREAM